ncbi:MAG: class I SAM-dependent methyltransferase [Nitrososphaeria archaeon]|nr:class I SAM-dependent methyltransferase [Nitrososphaeria archaeon]
MNNKLSNVSKWKLTTMKHYNALAKGYNELYGEEQKLKINFILKELDLGEKNIILDIGCGTCILFESIYNKDRTLIGIDISEKILREGWRKFKGKSNIMLVQADADHLPFRNKIFDTIFTITLIQNLPNPKATLQEIKRVSKKGALIIATGLKRKYEIKEFASIFEEITIKKIYDIENLYDYILYGVV